MQKTAIDWFIEQLPVRIVNQLSYYSKDLETAKEIQKEQIEEAFELGELNENSFQHTGRRIHKGKEEYYDKTYKEPKEPKPAPEAYYAGWLGLFENRTDIKLGNHDTTGESQRIS